ncbi:somatostatin receptor type 4-like [Ptychodera flava]|uniref:somatostatin receptor type 4-like n=1 Tax=Ptychodera flava TaxID=63121 RepID=UPI00396A41F8
MEYGDEYFNDSIYADGNGTSIYVFLQDTPSCGITGKEYSCLLFIFLISGILGNIVFIFAFVREETMRVDANFYLINLSVSEFVFLFVNSFMEILTFTYLNHHAISVKVTEALNLVYYISLWTSVCTSMLLILVIAADCYVMVCHQPQAAAGPLRRKYRSTLAVRIIWFVGISIGCVIAVSEVKTLDDAWKLGKLIFLCFLTIMPILLAIAFYTLITWELIRSHRFSGSGRNTEEIRVLKMCLMATAVFVVCSLPLVCYFSIGLYSRVTGHYHFVNGNVLLYCIASYFGFSIIINFAINSIIVNLGTRQHRDAVVHAIRNSVHNLRGREPGESRRQNRVNGSYTATDHAETKC